MIRSPSLVLMDALSFQTNLCCYSSFPRSEGGNTFFRRGSYQYYTNINITPIYQYTIYINTTPISILHPYQLYVFINITPIATSVLQILNRGTQCWLCMEW